MEPKRSNIEMIKTVYKALDNLNEDVVYVGGSVMELYVSDYAASKSRATDDVDIIAEILTKSKYDIFEEELRRKGFKNDIEGPACRFIFDNVKVDLISTQNSATGITNKWYETGFKKKITVRAGNVDINILPVAYYLASKLEAFKSRGARDPRSSHDLEDIIYVMDGNEGIKNAILSSEQDVIEYFRYEFGEFLKNENIREIINGHLGFDSFPERIDRIIDIMKLK